MLRDLFINTTILITFVSLASHLNRDSKIIYNDSLLYRIILGIITGILGVFLMLFAVRINDSVILDFRNVAIIMAAVFGGVLPAIVCSALIAAFRVLYYGVSTASIFGLVSVSVICTLSILITCLRIKSFHKWLLSVVGSMFVSSVFIFILLKNNPERLNIIFIYQLVSLIVFIIAYYYVSYCLKSNKIYNRFKEASSKDFLTGLNNVREFDKHYNMAIINAIEKNENLSLLMIDIDFFKKVNDTFGHNDGDAVLKELGNILNNSCRNFDIISRNGGEEFSVILLDCPQEQALKIAERIRTNVEKHPFLLSSGTVINLTVSIGVVSYPENTNEINNILKQSDEALYRAKQTGRNKVCIYDDRYNECYISQKQA